jgi:hypothetical protein
VINHFTLMRGYGIKIEVVRGGVCGLRINISHLPNLAERDPKLIHNG